MTSRMHLTRIPKSGNPVTDWVFGQFVQVLRRETTIIRRKRRLTNPDDPHRKVIRGLMDPDVDPSGRTIHIFINPAKDANRNRNEEVATLIHELAHVVMERASERDVLRLERTLTHAFTSEQLRFLKSFLPRHTVKRYVGRALVPLLPDGDRLATL